MSSRARTLFDVPRPRRVSRLVTGLAVVAGTLAGCAGGGEPAGTADRPTTSATPLASPACVTIEHEGRKLGVTVPAGFTVATPPPEAADIADTYRVNLLSLAQRAERGRTLPTAMLAVYGYGRGEREGQSALEASVLNFKNDTGGSSRGNPISATPTTVAGTQGAAGGDQDARALDYNAPDQVDSMLRWWIIPTDDGLFIVALGTATTELDARYSVEIPAGLTLGGC